MKRKLITRDNIYEHLLEKQLNLIDKTIFDALFDKKWKEWRISKKKALEFEQYALPLIRKTFKINKKKTLETYNYFIEKHGLIVQ